MKSDVSEIIKQAYDLHVHIGPEIIPRKYTAQSLIQSERGRLAGCALKNHFYPTAAMISRSKADGINLYGSVVLNNAVGGMNPEAVYAASLLSKEPIIVWLPTINSEQFLKTNKYEIAPEWVEDKSLKLKSAAETKPVFVTMNGKLTVETEEVIRMTARVGAILATGHIAPDESMAVAKFARSLGVPVIVTHPIYQHINMSIEMQKELATLGCYIEQSYSMYSMDGIAISEISKQIKAVGANSVILSSDVGQPFSLSPSEALNEFATLLLDEGMTLREVRTMLVDNPRKILGL